MTDQTNAVDPNSVRKTIVVEAGRTFKVLAENTLGDGFMASPAIAGKAFFVRSHSHLYRIES